MGMGISFRIQAAMHTRRRMGANSPEALRAFCLDVADMVAVFFFLFTEFM
jgi:hypothetical protein